MANRGHIWLYTAATCLLLTDYDTLRIRRLGVRVPSGVPLSNPCTSKGCRGFCGHFSGLRSHQHASQIFSRMTVMRFGQASESETKGGGVPSLPVPYGVIITDGSVGRRLLAGGRLSDPIECRRSLNRIDIGRRADGFRQWRPIHAILRPGENE